MTTRRDTLRASAAFLGVGALPGGATLSAAALGALAWPASRARANTAGRTIEVGVLISGTPDRWRLIGDAIEAGLREHGFTNGRNLVLHLRTATYPDRQMNAHVDELVRRRPDVIVTACGWSTVLATKATTTIPIVMATIADPVRRGFVRDLARPGANVTGMTGHVPDLGPKMLEYLALGAPRARVVAVLANGRNPIHGPQIRAVAEAGAALGMRVLPIDLHRLTSVDATQALFAAEGVQGIVVLPDDDLFFEYLDQIIPAADALRLPTIFPKRELVWRGAFMSYGADSHDIVRRAANHIARIVNGARPGDLPVEHPDRLELVINRTKAEQYGIDVPRAALMRAAEVYRGQ